MSWCNGSPRGCFAGGQKENLEVGWIWETGGQSSPVARNIVVWERFGFSVGKGFRSIEKHMWETLRVRKRNEFHLESDLV